MLSKPHKSNGKPGTGSTGQNCDGFLRIATNLPDVPADIIALLYHGRWTIEIFFRFFRHLLGCRHLLSHSQNGITPFLCKVWAGLLRDHRLHADQPVDREEAHAADSRDDLLVLLRHG
ncbi:MAG: transposase [Planctomycetaceae bacterium]|nr:transposase [Planctomycetaceae bacterium]